MSLNVADTGGGKEFALTPEGVYIARCYRIIDEGTQTREGIYGVQFNKIVSISWELLDDDVKMDDGRPFSIHKNYTASLHEKANLRKDLEAWRNKEFDDKELKEFDLKNIIGTYCQIQVVHSENGKYANVQTIMAKKFKQGEEKPKPVNENVIFDIDNPDMEVFNKLSENLRNKITGSPEWRAREAKEQTEAELPKGQKLDTVTQDISDEAISLDEIPF